MWTIQHHDMNWKNDSFYKESEAPTILLRKHKYIQKELYEVSMCFFSFNNAVGQNVCWCPITYSFWTESWKRSKVKWTFQTVVINTSPLIEVTKCLIGNKWSYRSLQSTPAVLLDLTSIIHYGVWVFWVELIKYLEAGVTPTSYYFEFNHLIRIWCYLLVRKPL